MGKKRKNSEREDEVEEPSTKKKIKYEETNGYHNGLNGFSNQSFIMNGDESRYEMYLIKKPISMSIDDLKKLKFSLDNDILKKSKLKLESGTYRAIVAPAEAKQKMVHIPAFLEIKAEDSRNIKPSRFVNGSITIIPAEPKAKKLGGALYEEGEEVDEDAELPQTLRPIKRQATLNLDSLKERNLAYGTTTDAEGNPRKLVDITP
ncbi:unnamed protein product [Caenorhabditis bovis]|uniref:Uncharacterized protein n=1 Tax=Caenorhabditis bovis TaxID=2654633 RepID=A0A8S1EQY0_9PELO|nr:unnamed protein product [Caenorhabditis bovis]